jgi:hypothetical protein
LTSELVPIDMNAHCADTPFPSGLTAEQHEFVRLSAVMGIPTALALADASEHVGRACFAGEVDMDQFRCLTDRLKEFLDFVVLAEPLVAELEPSTGLEVTGFRGRLLSAVDRVQDALDDCEPESLGFALARRLADVLAEYAELGGNVAMAIRGLPAAA